MKLATLCYIKKNGKTLMLYRNKKEIDIHKGKWNGVGGKFAIGETPEECVIREVKEETGLQIKNPTLVGRILFPAFTQHDEDWHVYLFTANDFKGELIESNEGVLEWISDEELMKLNLWEGDKIFFKWISEGKFFSAKFVYKGELLTKYEVTFYE